MRWALAGITLGALVGALRWAPAAWLASWIDAASGGRLLLAEAAGTIWDGSAVLVLAGGPGSRDASALPGRLSWSLRPAANGLVLRARQPCCLAGELALQVHPGWSGLAVRYAPAAQGGAGTSIGHWPAAWLAGLGTPWNTLRPGGILRASSSGLSLRWHDGRARVEGALVLDIDDLSTRVSPLPVLGSYRLLLTGSASGAEVARIALGTREGALQLRGSGQWSALGLRFRGEARAAAGDEAALANLLNLIGQRQGALSVITIG